MKTIARSAPARTTTRRPWAGSCELAYVSDEVFEALIDGATRLEERLDQERARQAAGTAPATTKPAERCTNAVETLRAPAAPVTAWYFDAHEFAPPAVVRSNASVDADDSALE